VQFFYLLTQNSMGDTEKSKAIAIYSVIWHISAGLLTRIACYPNAFLWQNQNAVLWHLIFTMKRTTIRRRNWRLSASWGPKTPLTHPCLPLRTTFAVRETASLGIMGSTIVSEGFKGGTQSAPIIPRDTVSRTANVERNGRHEWVKHGIMKL